MLNKDITKFIILTFLWSWIIWLPFMLPYFRFYEMTTTLSGLIMPAVILGAFGPMFAAIVLSYQKGRTVEVKNFFKRCLDFKVLVKFYIIATILAMGITVVAYYITTLSNISDLPKTFLPTDSNTPIVVIIIGYTIVLFLFGGGQEEFGWRGYLQDKSQDKFGIIYGSLFVGFIWGLWHLPLWLIEGEGHQYYSFIWFVIYTTSWSLTIGIIYNIAQKKMVIPWVMHTVSNLSVPLFPILFMEKVAQPGYTVWVLVNIVVAVVLAFTYYKNKSHSN